MNIDAILNNLTGIIALIGSAAAIWYARRKNDADASAQYAAASAQTVKTYAAENEKLLKRVDDLECKYSKLQVQVDEQNRLISEWKAGIDRLLGQLISLGAKPVWIPPSIPDWLTK